MHGGAVMKWIDLAAYACAAAWSGKYCITLTPAASALWHRSMWATWSK
ncbi:acyl-CoA hydrolase [Vibrio mimicus CAIM 602]|nr:acyl-CoA hydrolase [Vibrio mimicus CAIM 602]